MKLTIKSIAKSLGLITLITIASSTSLNAKKYAKKIVAEPVAETTYNGIYTDIDTGLQWQDAYKSNNNIIQYLNWDDATQYCSALSLEGSNWRLPTKGELRSFVKENKDKNLKALKRKKTMVKVNNYWASTVREENPDYAWRVSILYRNTYYFKKSLATNVRCVRALAK